MKQFCVVFACLFFAGCGRQKAVDSSLTGSERAALVGGLAELDAVLAARSPFVFSKLAGPATAADIDRLRAGLGGKQVDALEVWFQWHNGAANTYTEIIPLGSMLSIDEALLDRKMTAALSFVTAKRKNAIKILEDGAGDGFFLDVNSPTPRVFYDMLEDPGARDFGTLTEFVQFITQVHDAGLAKQTRSNGMIDYDLKAYNKLEAAYLRKAKGSR